MEADLKIANVVDKEVAISNGIIKSRDPDDFEAFIAKIIEEVKEGENERDAAEQPRNKARGNALMPSQIRLLSVK